MTMPKKVVSQGRSDSHDQSRFFRAEGDLRKWFLGILVCTAIEYFIVRQVPCFVIANAQDFAVDNNQSTTSSGTDGEDSNRLTNDTTTVLETSTTTDELLVGTKVCQIPEFNDSNEDVKRYMFDPPPIKCKSGKHLLPLVNSNLTGLYVDPEARNHFYKKSERVECCWRPFWRTEDKDDDVTYGKQCHKFNDSAVVEEEFVEVECRKEGKNVYKDYYAFVPLKEDVEERCNNRSGGPDRLSVLIHGLDSVSRLNFHRAMPETLEILRSLGAIEMLGYHSVAGSSFLNLVPLVSGMSEEQLKERCWPRPTMTFDSCPFVWKDFAADGYRTILYEDAYEITPFNLVRGGFQKPPTDYYLRPYSIASENNTGNTLGLCAGTRKIFDNLIDYSRKVAQRFANGSYFGFFWQSSLTQNFLNYARLGDRSYANFLRSMIDDGLLNNTALIMMSDHGIRWGEFRRTTQGRSEESLPFVFIVLPSWWRERFPHALSNLRRNARGLTTAYDLHETLMDFLRTDELDEESLKNRTEALPAEIMPRGVSWFLPITDRRSCSMAGIPSHYCACSDRNKVSVNDTAVLEVVDFVVTELNDILRKHPQCALLTLKTLLEARKWSDDSTTEYTVTVETSPGDALLETTVRQDTETSSKRLLGPMSRLNHYGNQSACIDDAAMRLYCYCQRNSNETSLFQ